MPSCSQRIMAMSGKYLILLLLLLWRQLLNGTSLLSFTSVFWLLFGWRLLKICLFVCFSCGFFPLQEEVRTKTRIFCTLNPYRAFPWEFLWQSLPKTIEGGFFEKITEQTVLKFRTFV